MQDPNTIGPDDAGDESDSDSVDKFLNGGVDLHDCMDDDDDESCVDQDEQRIVDDLASLLKD